MPAKYVRAYSKGQKNDFRLMPSHLTRFAGPGQAQPQLSAFRCSDIFFGMPSQLAFHEDFSRLGARARPSARNFGFTFAAVFAAAASYALWHGTPWGLAWLVGAIIFLLAAWLRPRVLEPLNELWSVLGHGLHKIVSPIVMLFLYIACVVPTGFIMRLCRRDAMSRRFEPNSSTYWIERDPEADRLQSMRNQF